MGKWIVLLQALAATPNELALVLAQMDENDIGQRPFPDQ
jgi:hypothetical protein